MAGRCNALPDWWCRLPLSHPLSMLLPASHIWLPLLGRSHMLGYLHMGLHRVVARIQGIVALLLQGKQKNFEEDDESARD